MSPVKDSKDIYSQGNLSQIDARSPSHTLVGAIESPFNEIKQFPNQSFKNYCEEQYIAPMLISEKTTNKRQISAKFKRRAKTSFMNKIRLRS